jgi:hypothetical protein
VSFSLGTGGQRCRWAADHRAQLAPLSLCLLHRLIRGRPKMSLSLGRTDGAGGLLVIGRAVGVGVGNCCWWISSSSSTFLMRPRTASSSDPSRRAVRDIAPTAKTTRLTPNAPTPRPAASGAISPVLLLRTPGSGSVSGDGLDRRKRSRLRPPALCTAPRQGGFRNCRCKGCPARGLCHSDGKFRNSNEAQQAQPTCHPKIRWFRQKKSNNLDK